MKERTKVDLVVMPTDKTMGLSVETKQSYKAEKVRKHTEAEFNSIGKVPGGWKREEAKRCW